MDVPPMFNGVSLLHLPCVRAVAGWQTTKRVVRRRSAPRTLVDPGKAKRVAEKGAVGLGVTGINDRVHACDHRSPSIELCRERMMFMGIRCHRPSEARLSSAGAACCPQPNLLSTR